MPISKKFTRLFRSILITIFGTVFCLWIWSFHFTQEFPNIQNNLTLNEITEKEFDNVDVIKPDSFEVQIKNETSEDALADWVKSVDQILLEYKESEQERLKLESDNFIINKDRGFWSGNDSVNYHIFDEPLAKELLKFFKSERATDVIDLGGGMGKYTEYFVTRDLSTRCYDGNPDSQDISEGRCAVLDLTKEIQFFPYDWVLSLEVGEHLPKMYESMYLKNIDRLNKKGAVISWAVEGQGGSGHVNNRNNSYVIQKMKELNYTYDEVSSQELRDYAFWSWFKNTIMVFRKIVSKFNKDIVE